MSNPKDLSGITRKRYWLIARLLFIGCKPKRDAGDCVLHGISMVGIMFQLHKLNVQQMIILSKPVPKYPKGGPASGIAEASIKEGRAEVILKKKDLE